SAVMPVDASRLLADLEAVLRPLELAVTRSWWDANVHSSDETEARRQQAELRLREALGDATRFAAVEEALADPSVAGVERRQLERLRSEMLPNQLDDQLRRELVEHGARVESLFNTHRGVIDGERVDDNRIAEILLRSDDVELRRQAWEASKSVGAAAAGLVLELVGLRNQAAVS